MKPLPREINISFSCHDRRESIDAYTLATPVLATSKPTAIKNQTHDSILSANRSLTTTTASAARWGQELPLQFCKLRLELSYIEIEHHISRAVLIDIFRTQMV